MTGNNSTPAEKLRAVFLAALMVGSVFAMGVAFSGTAAAANSSVSAGNVDTVGDDVNFEIAYDTDLGIASSDAAANSTVVVEHNYTGTNYTLQFNSSTGNFTTSDVTIPAAKDDGVGPDETGFKVYVNGSYNNDVVTYSTTYYDVETTDDRDWGTSAVISGTIYEYPNEPEDDINVDYSVYTPNNATEAAQGDTDSGQFSQKITFDTTLYGDDKDYPADQNVSASAIDADAYTTYVNPDPSDSNPGAGPTQFEGFADTRVLVQPTVNVDDPLTYGDTSNVSGQVTDGLGNSLSGYLVEVQSNDTSKIKGTDTAGDGSYLFTMTFDDAGYWDFGTNRSGFIQYENVFVDSAEGTLSISPADTQRDFQHNYTVTFEDQDGNLLDLNNSGAGDADSYVNVTIGEGFSLNAVKDSSGTSLNGPTGTSTSTGADYNTYSTDSDSEPEVLQVQNLTSSEFYVEATPTNGSSIDGYAQWEETTRDSPGTPDVVATGSANIVDADLINLRNLDIKDEVAPNTGFQSIDLDGDGEFGDSPNQTVKVLPLATQSSERLINGERVGNDSNFAINNISEYSVSFELINQSSVDFTFDSSSPNVTSITLQGAGVNKTITSSSDSSYSFNAGGNDRHNVTFKPTEKNSTDDDITATVNVEFTDGSTGSTTLTIPTDGLDIEEFEVDGDTQDSVEVGSTVNITSIVQEADGQFVNNGKVRVAQRNTNGDFDELGNFDARIQNTNDGRYVFDGLAVNKVAVDLNNDGLAETDAPLSFTAYQYSDADGDLALNQNEVTQAAVETLDVDPSSSLQIDFVTNEEHEYALNGGQSLNLTGGVEYDNITVDITYDDGTPVDLTDGTSGVTLGPGLVGQLLTVNGHNTTVSLTDPANGTYTITEINGSTGPTSGTAVDAAYNDDTILFNNSQVGGDYDIDVVTPNKSYSDASDQGSFDVVAPMVDSEITQVELSNGSVQNVSDVETMTANIGRTYTVDATVTDQAGMPINDSSATVQLITDGSNWDFNVSDSNSSPDALAEVANGDIDANGTFTYTVTPGSNGDVDYYVEQHSASPVGTPSALNIAGYTADLPNTVNATAIDNGPAADTPTVNVFDFAGGVIPDQEWQTSAQKELEGPTDEGSTSTMEGITLPKDVSNKVRIEAFPADTDDAALPQVFVGVPQNNNIGENAVFTKTAIANDTELASNYTQGQLGFFTFTPQGTGSDVIQLTWAFGSADDVLNGTSGGSSSVVEYVDVAQSTEQLEITSLPGNAGAGETVEGQVVDADGFSVSNARVFVTAPNSQTMTITANADGEFNFTVQQGGTYNVRTVRTGYEPSRTYKVTVEQATVEFSDQNSSGSSVTVDSTFLPNGGYVVIHNASGAVLGNSEYLSAGSHTDVQVTLDQPISADQTLTAMAHTDDGDQTYEFPGADGPYTIGNNPVTDDASITIATNPSVGDNPPAQNLDNDSQLEDVNGDGVGDLFDALDYYNNRDTDVIQDNPDLFDFDGDGEAGTLFDALALYNEISA